jgi:hypothetical protein
LLWELSVEQEDIPTLQIEKEQIGDLATIKVETSEHEQGRFIKRLDTAIKIAAPAISLALIYFIASSLYPDFLDFYRHRLKPAAVFYWPNAVAVIVLLVLGFNLYLFRGYRRLWFGITEIAFASGLGWYAINKAVSGSVADATVILFAALYLMGRGFLNVSSVFRPLQIERKEKQN